MVKFCVKLNKTPKETRKMLKEAFVDACMSYSQANKLHKLFREGREDVTRRKFEWASSAWNRWSLFSLMLLGSYTMTPVHTPGQTFNAQYYKQVLQRLNYRIIRVRKEILPFRKMETTLWHCRRRLFITSYLNWIGIETILQLKGYHLGIWIIWDQ